jgi:hypothetical protein
VFQNLSIVNDYNWNYLYNFYKYILLNKIGHQKLKKMQASQDKKEQALYQEPNADNIQDFM